jgi:hypothetical protein
MKVQAASLLTKAEVSAVQETEIPEVVNSETANGSLFVSQSYYTAKETNKSVSVTLSQNVPESRGSHAAQDYWEQTFGRFGDAKVEKEPQAKGREEEEEKAPPEKIDGLGAEAYWSGNRVGGALYVFKNNMILRISVGGPDNKATKLEKSKQLALEALPRL